MSRPYTLYGWHLSYFTGKVRSYLLHKGIAFIDQPVNLFTLMWTIKRQTGAVVARILKGEKPGAIASAGSTELELFVNPGAAAKQGATLSADLLKDAKETVK